MTRIALISTLTFVVCTASPPAWASPGTPGLVTLSDTSEVTIHLSDLIHGALLFDGVGGGDHLHIYPEGTSLVTTLKTPEAGCHLARDRAGYSLVHGAEGNSKMCDSLFEVKTTQKYVVLVDDVTTLFRVRIYVAATTSTIVQVVPGSLEPDPVTQNAGPPQLISPCALIEDKSYPFFAGKWTVATLKFAGQTPAGGTAGNGKSEFLYTVTLPGGMEPRHLLSRLNQGKPVVLRATRADGDQEDTAFKLSLRPEPPGAGTQPPDPAEAFEKACDVAMVRRIRALLEDTGTEADDCKSGADDLACWSKQPHRWFYLVCVDMSVPDDPIYSPRTSKPGVDPHVPGSAHFFTRREIAVAVYHQQGWKATVTISGADRGYATGIRGSEEDQRGENASARTPAPKARVEYTTTVFDLGPRKSNDEALLTITLDKPKTATSWTTVAERERLFKMENRYFGAVRTGIGVLWSPLEREYGAVMSGGTNTGSYYGVTAGDGLGVTHVELLFGFSFFFKLMNEYAHGELGLPSHRAGMGWYLGGGLLSGGETGMLALSGLYTGPELLIGPDMSIGLVAGIRRANVQHPNYEVGQAIAAAVTVAEHSGAAFAVGLLVNLSPDFFKAIEGK